MSAAGRGAPQAPAPGVPAETESLGSRAVLSIAVPVMLSNVTTPLIGVVDTAIIGRIPDPAYIGAVAVGALLFTSLFWAFGFLRMATSGLAAQALGARDSDELAATLHRSLLIALVAGMLLIALQWPIREVGFRLIGASAQVESLSRGYFDIRIWAAPATLVNFALLGWFIGRGRADLALLLQLMLNLVNIALDALFVLGFGWGVRGVAAGTLIAELGAAAAGVAIAVRHLRALPGGAAAGSLRWSRASVWARQRLRRTLAVNSDLMLRSLALIAVVGWFAAQGARQGDVVLAANAVLMHFVMVAAYFLDGLAFAAEALVGRAVGARDRLRFAVACRLTTGWAFAVAALLSALAWLAGPALIDLLTVDAATRQTARNYLPWAAFSPLLGVWAFQLDGIFVGATRSGEMRNAMLLSLAIFIAGWWLLTPFGNHGLWAALYVHYVARIATLARHYPALLRTVAA
ncbi:MAG TPA: MATE family efflux transporter [Burkholderiaceae bacterium]|nr:MATE family efflux transporter [Burkholderiaceae bacterium]